MTKELGYQYFTGFVKQTTEDGRVGWVRYTKNALTKLEISKIKALRPAQAKNLYTEEKSVWFYGKTEVIQHRSASSTSVIEEEENFSLDISRDKVFQDSFEKIRGMSGRELRENFKVSFTHEISQDAGGVVREWFSNLVETMFLPSTGLFRKTKTPYTSYVINEHSGQQNKNHLEYFRFCGQIIAKALWHKIPIKAFLNKVLLKKLIGIPYTYADLKYYDEEIWKSIKYIKCNEILPGDSIATFTVNDIDPVTGTETIIELKEKGRSIWIKEENKEEFVELYLDYVLHKSTDAQFIAFNYGFSSLVPYEMLQVLDEDELELFLCGDVTIDVKDWKQNTLYKGAFDHKHQIITWFWEILEKLNQNELERLLQFCTGSSRVPAEGFRGLTTNNNKPCPFTIEPKLYGSTIDDFPVAHTCFNKLELPIYPDIKAMEKSLRILINSPICFQFSLQ